MAVRAPAAVIVAAIVGAARGARADLPPLDPNGTYAIDLYSGAAIGSARIVGMGGAAIASAEGSAGTVDNPAAAAVRPATSTGAFDWDWHLDGQSAVYASDLDNNGRDRGGGATLATFGLLFDWREWSGAVVGTSQRTQFETMPMGVPVTLGAAATRGRLAIARTWGDQAWTVGGAVDVATFQLDRANQRLFQIDGAVGLAGGVVWRQPGGNWRAGAAASLPLNGDHVINDCGTQCDVPVLPARVEAPWQVGAGVAYRWGETGWNRQVAGDLRVEHAVTVALDVVVSGNVADGIGLEAFGEKLEQRSGLRWAWSTRAGVEWECVPGHVRLRGGSYWEPGRFEGAGGRPHVTAGFEAGALDFTLWGRHRLRMSITGDLAPRYGTASVSVGFWH